MYHFIVHQDDDGVWAECQELPGCVTQSDSLDTLRFLGVRPRSRPNKHSSLKTIEMTYTAAVKQVDKGWIGWVEEIPGVNCQEPTYEALMETMTETLREAIDFNKSIVCIPKTSI